MILNSDFSPCEMWKEIMLKKYKCETKELTKRDNNHKKRQNELHSVSNDHRLKLWEEEPTTSRSSSSPLLRHPIWAWSLDRRRPEVQEVDPHPGPSGCVTSFPSTRRDSVGRCSRHELQRQPGECGELFPTPETLWIVFITDWTHRPSLWPIWLPPSLPFSGECSSGEEEVSEKAPFWLVGASCALGTECGESCWHRTKSMTSFCFPK